MLPYSYILTENEARVEKNNEIETYGGDPEDIKQLITGGGAVVVDVAMNRNEAGKLCGDVDYAAVAEKASYITPVPGGVGPMTRAILMKNVLAAAKDHQK